eukprot:TRINITY_DN8748_c0_g2_i10.p1 TRINITY_DN8748_c0_g2~~TRINITY_DN8748_c0_g2_i10.p1  ORF type:complete len:269 (+),score=52.73 TRINITY_DN8748_c0_g2_i10:95-901(+)
MTELTIEELQKQIVDYEIQLEVVNGALVHDPSQPEFLEVKKNLVGVLNVTKDLLKLKKETAPPVLYDNIQEIATAKGFYVGMKCEALWNEDKRWYKAIITSVTRLGFGVKFTGYGTVVNVGPTCLRHLKKPDVVLVDSATSQQTSVKTPNKTTLVVDKRTGELILPSSLKILPTDAEAVRKVKKKGVKALKNEHRKVKAEEDRNKRKCEWQDFQNKKRTRHNQSIFKSPDSVDGKVGVTRSGMGMTSFTLQKYEPKKLQGALPVVLKQ